MKIASDSLVDVIELDRHEDARGCLSALEFGHLPFVPARIFVVSDVPVGGSRGGHAHRQGEQILLCLSGRIEIELDNGAGREVIICEPDGKGIVLKQKTWAKQTFLEPNSVLLAICSHPYDPSSYIDQFGNANP